MSVSRLRTRFVNIHSRILDEHILMLILAIWSSETMTRRGVSIRTPALLPSLASSHYSASSWTRCVHVEEAGLAYFSGCCQRVSLSLNVQFLTVSAVDEQGGCPTFPKLTLMLVIPMCFPNTYKYKPSVETHPFLLNDYYLRSTFFDSFES